MAAYTNMTDNDVQLKNMLDDDFNDVTKIMRKIEQKVEKSYLIIGYIPFVRQSLLFG